MFPSLDLDIVFIEAPYPGAAPEEVFTQDRVLQALVVTWVVVFALATYA